MKFETEVRVMKVTKYSYNSGF